MGVLTHKGADTRSSTKKTGRILHILQSTLTANMQIKITWKTIYFKTGKQIYLPYSWTDVVVEVVLNESANNTRFPNACILELL